MLHYRLIRDSCSEVSVLRLSRASVVLTATLLASCSKSAAPPLAKATPSPAASQGMFPPVDRTTPLPSPLPDIAARVNGQLVPLAHVEILAREILSRRMKEGGNVDTERPFAYRQAVQQLIVRELLLEEAMNRKITADDKKVEQAYNEARLNYKDEDTWKTFLANQGLTVDAFRSQIRTQLTISGLLDQEVAKEGGEVSDQEAMTFYQSNPAQFESGDKLRLSHILLRVPQGAAASEKQATRTRLEGILARVRKGEDFAKLAKANSQDQGSAGRGGLLDDVTHGQIDPALEKVALALKPGEVSEVVETPFGFHIIKLIGKLPSEHLQFDSIKDRIKQFILANRRQRHLETLVAGLREKATIETYL